jgi:hypothetical protein
MREALLAAAEGSRSADSTPRRSLDRTQRMRLRGYENLPTAAARLLGEALRGMTMAREWRSHRALGMLRARVPRRWAAAAAVGLVVLAIVAAPLLANARQTNVPDVSGRSVHDAQSAISAAGLTLAVDEQATEDAPAGVVISQDPPASRRVGAGATVHAVVSSGLTVPDLVGRQCAEARAALGQAGWTVKPVRWRVAGIADFGKVVGQDPPAGTVVHDKGQISVQVAGPVRPC